MRILDIGCGPGTITADLAALVPQGHVTGLDQAPDVLELARATAAERGVSNVSFAVGDVHALDYADGAFDVVHTHQVLQHITDPVQALREMRRVTAPGGLVAAREADFPASAWYPEDVQGLPEWRDLYVQVARANGGEPAAGRRLHVWARQAGFDPARVATSASTMCYSGPAQREWWGGLWADRIRVPPFSQLAVEGGHASAEDLERAAAAWRAWANEEDAWFVIMHGEILCRMP
ncbi:hypothetical protein WJX81_008638 [Elliptochloris bilobata]|uniref:Methyltransferase domain-containing protein n=1 Tax=Elliptochloris bilobata TaxID=381761 RepID=A0AAW1RUH0_9CHLO